MLTALKQALETDGEVYFRVKARPGARATAVREIMADEEETVKIDIAAAPERGRANTALIKFLAEEFEVPKADVKILSGAGDRVKLVKIIRS